MLGANATDNENGNRGTADDFAGFSQVKVRRGTELGPLCSPVSRPFIFRHPLVVDQPGEIGCLLALARTAGFYGAGLLTRGLYDLERLIQWLGIPQYVLSELAGVSQHGAGVRKPYLGESKFRF
jgi:hypothetical protein